MEKHQGDEGLKEDDDIEDFYPEFAFLNTQKTPQVGLNIHGEDVQTHRKSYRSMILKPPEEKLIKECETQIQEVKEVTGLVD
jgi:hypothetical protein